MKNSPKKYRHVVFDWNGTIIDDVALSIRSMNVLCAEHGLTLLDTESYRQHFMFPISAFYSNIGFDFQRTEFSELMRRYLELFNLGFGDCPLFDDLRLLSREMHDGGCTIAILSATQQRRLISAVSMHNFGSTIDYIVGLDDELATGKHERARWLDEMLRQDKMVPVLMVGDTIHDHDVATERGWDFVAVASGHQSRQQLEQLGAPVIEHLSQIKSFILL